MCGGLSRPGVPSLRPLVRHSTRSVHSAGSVRLPFRAATRARCVCVRSRSRGFRPPPPPGSVWRAHHTRFWGRALVGPFQVVRAPPHFLPWSRALPSLFGGEWPGPCAPFPGSGLRAPSWAGLCVRGGPAPGGCGGGGGAVRLLPPLGAWLGPGRSGVLGGRGAGGRSASVRPFASLVRAPMRASLASLCPWRVWSPYCSGSCPCAPVWARSEEGAVGRPCAPVTVMCSTECRQIATEC